METRLIIKVLNNAIAKNRIELHTPKGVPSPSSESAHQLPQSCVPSTSLTFSRAGISKQAKSNKDSPSSALSASRTKLSQNINSQTRSEQRKSPNPSTEPQGSHCRKHRHHSSTLSIHPPLPFGGINASMKTPTCAPANTRTRPRCPSKTRQNARRPGRRIYCCFHE